MRPLLPATFQPQAWVDDNAVDIDGRTEFDAADAFLSQEPAVMVRIAKEILSGRHDLDELEEGVDVPHSGPFVIDVSPVDLTVFLALHQVWRLDDLDEKTMSEMKDRNLKDWTPDADTLSGMFSPTEGHPAFSKDEWRAEKTDQTVPYWLWLEARLKEAVEPFQPILFDEWDRSSRDGWHMRMPARSVSETLSGETPSMTIAKTDGRYVVGTEMHVQSGDYPSLGLAKLNGARLVEEAFEKGPALIAKEMEIDTSAFKVDIDEDTITVYPIGEGEFPGLVVSPRETYLDQGASREETFFPSWKEGVAALKESRPDVVIAP